MSKPPQHRKLQGIVVSDLMDKTVVVRIDRVATHPKYGKKYTMSKRLKAHDPLNTYHKNDKVIIEETRPLSAQKRWKVIARV